MKHSARLSCYELDRQFTRKHVVGLKQEVLQSHNAVRNMRMIIATFQNRIFHHY